MADIHSLVRSSGVANMRQCKYTNISVCIRTHTSACRSHVALACPRTLLFLCILRGCLEFEREIRFISDRCIQTHDIVFTILLVAFLRETQMQTAASASRITHHASRITHHASRMHEHMISINTPASPQPAHAVLLALTSDGISLANRYSTRLNAPFFFC